MPAELVDGRFSVAWECGDDQPEGFWAPLQVLRVAVQPALTGSLLGWTRAAIGAAST
jgi:hypothetical protein